ncbi:unnamed protein product [Kluyveromyces dobzhanskii CBS 2104]|uniref:WGS project CCBQ000000000 data, contig 00043 n=1 Tax=Kluyveromyces dobzhanskii CBS 2104 TaxID=1427455 RepID=A0A0A8L2N2_9SACH|nr:unnamed protein product [Kluyveromyces dobzhanskii CBS 2104]
MSGRLPGLNQGKPSTGTSLKFKPKAVARKSKEERDANALKVEEPKKQTERKKYTQKPQNAQKRQPKYLNNTRVITSGPLTAGNFSGGSTTGATGFIKTEGSQSSLLQQGLKAVSDDEAEVSDSENMGNGKRINMGKEYTEADFKKENDDLFEDENVENNLNADAATTEEIRASKQLANLFPVRAVRINHDKVDSLQKAVQESMSSLNTRKPTPGPVKLEQDQTNGTLSDVVKEKELELKEKLRLLQLQQDFQSVDSEETLRETALLLEDHERILKKLNRINDVPNKFMFLQFPSNLPEFQPQPRKLTEENGDATDGTAVNGETNPSQSKSNKQVTVESSEPLVGNVGSIRVHQSGRMSIKIGNVTMDINRGAESTFLQDVVMLDLEGEEAELLGQIDGRVVVTPRI